MNDSAGPSDAEGTARRSLRIRQLLPARDGAADLLQLYDNSPSQYLRAGFVVSVDGRASIDGRSAPLSGPADKAVFAALRAVCDVVLVGAGTARSEDYGPVVSAPVLRQWRTQRGRSEVPPVAVVSRTLDLDPQARLFQAEARPLILTCSAADSGRRSALSAVATVLVVGDRDVDLPTAVAALLERGMGRVLCEGGPTLLRKAVEQDVVDELCLTMSPVLAGTGPSLLDGLSRTRDLQLMHLLEHDGALMARYRLGSMRELATK